ncbi:helix-turn-helix domain-containing protein [Pandoraea sp.]|uniref:MarR family winged helix-turn-helix transcriptional regulator n=1 Tax=Pandoraea sp. TaxID=1883445 RepID=UPI0011F7A863|nr:helix-turn-helix domain-containing protein [Pandoraea sp.]TAL54578.1 MAG: MarR family transcriptional regulator [Pandoraea sp.]TAM15779.1 MAG: MarR family transcriptional regulator [Pandoraea sp.]
MDIGKRDFETLSELRYRLRCFQRFSENAAQQAGITPHQYLLLLHLKGFPERNWATVGELAERLQMSHHGVVALVSRAQKLQLVSRKSSSLDRRQVEVHLLARGEYFLRALAARHRAELETLEKIFKTSDFCINH